MIPFQGVCNLYFATVNLQFGLHITSEKKTRKLGLLKTSGNETRECKYLKKKTILKRSLTVMTGVLWCFA